MPACVLTIAQQKGGAGKSTLAAQLSVAFRLRGCKVGLIDVDPQASLSLWFETRIKHLGKDEVGLVHSQVSGWKLAGEIDRMKSKLDVIIVDTPPHAETDARVAVRAANLVLVPLQPSPMDLWATGPTLELVKKEKSQALIVVNRIPPKGKLPQAVLAKIDEAGLPMAQTMLGNRMAFASSMMTGHGVQEVPPKTSAASAEIATLAQEIAKPLGLKL